VGQEVEVLVEEIGVTVKPVGTQTMTLEQKLALFDPKLHGGEVMATTPIGAQAM
jgi:antitoxin MazE